MAEGEDDDWAASEEVQILHVSHTGERADGNPAPVIHNRTIPLALRVRQGALSEAALVLENEEIPWEHVQYVAVGVVHHALNNMEPPKTMVRQVFGKIMGKDDKSERKAKNHQESILLDIYTGTSENPYRLDSVNVNYKAFLGGDQQFISVHNFYRLLVRLARLAKEARLNEAAVNFILRRREQIRPSAAVYDFELECQNEYRNRLDTLKKTTDLDLSRDNYAEEWGEDDAES